MQNETGVMILDYKYTITYVYLKSGRNFNENKSFRCITFYKPVEYIPINFSENFYLNRLILNQFVKLDNSRFITTYNLMLNFNYILNKRKKYKICESQMGG